jgi:3',5'-cyclic AMP phosphodiesterase CpdA
MDEIVSIGTNSAVVMVDDRLVHLGDLEPATDVAIGQLRFTTLPSAGALLSRVVTMNDVHFGETRCGEIDGFTGGALEVEPGDDPYPLTMNRSVCADADALNPEAVIVKGDLTNAGRPEEFQAFLDCYVGTFGDMVAYVRGNHDSYHAHGIADTELQIIDVVGLRVVLVDTARSGEAGGFLSDEQLRGIDDAAASTTSTVIVMGHHPLVLPEAPADGHRSMNGPDSEAFMEVAKSAVNVVAYTAGHTHRCRRVEVAGISVIDVAAVKDFPGAFAEYQVREHGIVQLIHRASAPAALRWAERTSTMFAGLYRNYAMGTLADRSFTLPRRQPQ